MRLLGVVGVAEKIGVSVRSLERGFPKDFPVPIDIRQKGAKRPVWRWESDLVDKYIEDRREKVEAANG